ncbi:F-box protein [Phanerochaete sordida]|uniref:F-box protein n=1 Tax=Phanerochaete sordida TaxID=48140 RepID=A0A9P3GKV2_9APHY|nr:F-box protein [Phanerochaete sordida]
MAQTCNDDVLFDIMRRLPAADLVSSALVCRRWCPTAQSRLYRRICLDTNAPSFHHLSNMLSSDPWLRSLVRDVVIFHRAGSKDHRALFHWLELLPAGSLRSLRIEQMFIPKPEDLSLLRTPAVRAVQSLSVWPAANFLSTERLEEVLQLGALESLSIRILPYLLARPLTIRAPLRLRALSIDAPAHCPTVSALLAALDPARCTRLALVTNTLACAPAAALAHDLRHLLPRLRHLALHPRQARADAPLLDALVPAMPALRTLACGGGTCSADVLARLPPAFETLTLVASTREPFPDAAFAKALRAAPVPQSMRTLAVVDVSGRWASMCCSDKDELESACASRGIAFEVVEKGSCEPLFFESFGR